MLGIFAMISSRLRRKSIRARLQPFVRPKLSRITSGLTFCPAVTVIWRARSVTTHCEIQRL